MNPGQLVFDLRLGKVVEVVRRISDRLYHIRPLGRRHISKVMPARSAFLVAIRQQEVTSWVDVGAVTGWNPSARFAK